MYSTDYYRMKFKRLDEWDIFSFHDGYTSPVFEFENGDTEFFINLIECAERRLIKLWKR